MLLAHCLPLSIPARLLVKKVFENTRRQNPYGRYEMACLIVHTTDSETGIVYESYYDFNQDNEEALERIEGLLTGKNSNDKLLIAQLAHLAAESFKRKGTHREEVNATLGNIRKVATGYIDKFKNRHNRNTQIKKLPV